MTEYSRPTLMQTLRVAMEALQDRGPLIALYPTEENFRAADTGQSAPVIAWTETMVYTRRAAGSLNGEPWMAVPRNPVPSFTQMLRMGYT